LGRVKVIDDAGEIQQGQSGLAQITLEGPVVAHMNDRFILRSYSPSVTIAGGVILNPLAVKVRRKDLSRVRRVLGALQTADKSTQFVTFVEQAKEHGQTLEDICARTGWRRSLAMTAAEEAQAKGSVSNCEGVFIAKADFENLSQLVIEAVRAHH